MSLRSCFQGGLRQRAYTWGRYRPPYPQLLLIVSLVRHLSRTRLNVCSGYGSKKPFRRSAQSSPFPPLADTVSVRMSALVSFTKNSSNTLCEHLGYGGEAPHVYAFEALGLRPAEPLLGHRRCPSRQYYGICG